MGHGGLGDRGGHLASRLFPGPPSKASALPPTASTEGGSSPPCRGQGLSSSVLCLAFFFLSRLSGRGAVGSAHISTVLCYTLIMDKSIIQVLLEKGLSSREVARELATSPGSIRYWMRKYGLKSSKKPFGEQAPLEHLCSRCGECNPDNFYGHKKTICGPCHSKYTLRLGHEKRAMAIEHLGGKCAACGFSRHSSALDIHHRDPASKDPNFISMRNWSWNRIAAEIVSCVLLCKNCHALVHSKIIEV